jgi:hypothetical protein
MTYQEALKKSFQVKWKIGTCSEGEECFCRTIKPIEPILYEDSTQRILECHIVGSGRLQKEIAEHFVKLHNQKFGGNDE